MSDDPVNRRAASSHPFRVSSILLLAALSAGCAGADELPRPRPLVIHSGARIAPDPARMEEIDGWVRSEMQNIREDPSFLIVTVPVSDHVYPWETLVTRADTATIHLQEGAADAVGPYQIYAHLHLMHEMGRLEEFLADAAGETGYALERAIVGKVADSWLLGRAVYDLTPYRLLDEILYARENDFLDAYLLTARAEDFPGAREAWMTENPGRQDEFEEWFRATFGMEPPGLRD